jgi:eukaryotic-like serine/threonine-protein kinase
MTREEWQRVKTIASEALAQPDADRARWVAERCAGNDALRREVLTILASIHSAADLFETPQLSPLPALAILADAADAAESIVGGRIGPYRVLSEIGRGGMGAAYLAVRADEEFEKRVALKLIKRGMDTDAILRRFRHERQILANLEHPNIVMLLDGGTTPAGLPYFVMEYVDGVPIDAFCDANGLSVAERLVLFQSVCAAVDYAHEHRVLHRDLKPSNILVTKRGVPKLLDFGIAKLLDADTDRHGPEPTILARAMTPQYASPEQIRGEPLTQASDVYSLGVLLFRLLTGKAPFRRDVSAHGHSPAAGDETPPRPSTVAEPGSGRSPADRPRLLRRILAGNLDTIVLTALQRDPARRYATARAMADDIQRHLEGRPIVARTSRLDRIRHGARSRLAIAASVIALLATVIAFAATRLDRSDAGALPARAVAVLPFAIVGDHADLEYLSDGITEDVIARLSQAPNLKVIGRDSVHRYKGQEIDPQQVGRTLGVQAVVIGRVTLDGGRVSVAAELIDAPQRRTVWRQIYDRDVTDLQQLERELAQRIATGLQLTFSEHEASRFGQRHTHDPDAYQDYLKGRFFWNKRTTGGFRTSIDYFKRAVAKDPTFALAYSGLADAYGLLTEYHAAPASETYPEARAAVLKALQLDDASAEAHVSRAYLTQFYEWDWAAADREYTRALSLNPNYATGLQWYAEYLSSMGRHAEALAEIGKAKDVDPLSLIVNAVEANMLYMAREYDRAIEKSKEVLVMDPNFPEAYEYLKRSYDQKGMYRDAIAARQMRRRLLGLDVGETPALRAAANATSARVYWQARLEQELIEAKTEGLQPFEYAELLAQAGHTAQALEWLGRACRDTDFMMMYIRVAPNLDPVRAEPGYQEILNRSCRVATAADGR